MENPIVLGVDIGGSHITAALVNLKTKQILGETLLRDHVNSKDSATEIISVWTRVMQTVFDNAGVTDKKIGVAMPNPFDYEEGISLMQNQDKYDALYGYNIRNILAENLGIDKNSIKFMNDAECFLKGEVFGGIAMDLDRVIGLTLGTGLGSSKYSDGVVEDADLWNSPFRDSIAEEYISTRWFTKRYHEITGKHISNVKQLIDMENTEDIRDQIFNEFGRNIALFLNSFIDDVRPQAIILGGNIANAYELFSESLHHNLTVFPFPFQIHKTQLGEDACLIGAASTWHKNEVEVI